MVWLRYSPDPNPIEKFFAKLKHWLRKAAKRTPETVCQAIAETLARRSPHKTKASGWPRLEHRAHISRSTVRKWRAAAHRVGIGNAYGPIAAPIRLQELPPKHWPKPSDWPHATIAFPPVPTTRTPPKAAWPLIEKLRGGPKAPAADRARAWMTATFLHTATVFPAGSPLSTGSAASVEVVKLCSGPSVPLAWRARNSSPLCSHVTTAFPVVSIATCGEKPPDVVVVNV